MQWELDHIYSRAEESNKLNLNDALSAALCVWVLFPIK